MNTSIEEDEDYCCLGCDAVNFGRKVTRVDSSTLKMEEVSFSETLVILYRNLWQYIRCQKTVNFTVTAVRISDLACRG